MDKATIAGRKLYIQEIQKYILEQPGLDGWLIYDFHGKNALGLELLGIDANQLLSRRFYYWIPKSGTPIKIVHHIEAQTLNHLPGDQIAYESWQSLDSALTSTLKGQKRIAMEHSPMGAIPVLSTLDAGLYEWLHKKKIEVVNSWILAKNFICRWTPAQLKAHKDAAKFLMNTFETSFERVQNALASRKKITEYSLQQDILQSYEDNGFMTEHAPVVAVGPNSVLSHYSPTKEIDTRITKDSLLLIDIWCKKNKEHAPYADFTQVAFYGKTPSSEMIKVYNTVKAAQTAGIEFVKKSLKQGKDVFGCDVDDVCRKIIQKQGYGQYFVHRTGHNIHTMLHGLGPNLDNYETHDSRPLMPRTCYSVEPGIYIPKAFGVRLECNIFIHDNLSVEVTGQSPETLPCLY
ncbi:MAG: M24 family metallopeptidase [Chlamydiales bacterium]|nr:M24 family metallopeptidase [Chlamydiales bacterium]